MRRALAPLCAIVAAAATVGCGALLGTDFTGLQPLEDGGAPDANGSVDAGSSPVDGAPSAGNTAACGSGTSICVVGGFFSIGRAGIAATLPDGAAAAVVDDGFEQGGAKCDPSGVFCVTGAMTP